MWPQITGQGQKLPFYSAQQLLLLFNPFHCMNPKPKSSSQSESLYLCWGVKRCCNKVLSSRHLFKSSGGPTTKYKMKFGTLSLFHGERGLCYFLTEEIYFKIVINSWKNLLNLRSYQKGEKRLVCPKFHCFCSLLTLVLGQGEHISQTLKTKCCSFVTQV